MSSHTQRQPSKTYFGSRLRDAQGDAGLSNRQLAIAADISESLLGKYKRGDSTPGLEIASRLARAVGKPLEFFAEPEEIAA